MFYVENKHVSYLRNQILEFHVNDRIYNGKTYLSDTFYLKLYERLLQLEPLPSLDYQEIVFHRLTSGYPIKTLVKNAIGSTEENSEVILKGPLAFVNFEEDLHKFDNFAATSGYYIDIDKVLYKIETSIEGTGQTFFGQLRFPGELILNLLAWIDNTGIYHKYQKDENALNRARSKRVWRDMINLEQNQVQTHYPDMVNFQVLCRMTKVTCMFYAAAMIVLFLELIFVLKIKLVPCFFSKHTFFNFGVKTSTNFSKLYSKLNNFIKHCS